MLASNTWRPAAGVQLPSANLSSVKKFFIKRKARAFSVAVLFVAVVTSSWVTQQVTQTRSLLPGAPSGFPNQQPVSHIGYALCLPLCKYKYC